MSTSAEPQALNIGQAARRLGVHRETLRSAIKRGEIPAARLGRRWLVPVTALDRLLAPPVAANHDREPS
jgi:excisionase family DNA binding protein